MHTWFIYISILPIKRPFELIVYPTFRKK